MLVRLLPNGQPDTSFGSGTRAPAGVVDTGISGSTGHIKLLDGGTILFATGTRVIRFKSDGSVDEKFRQDEPARFKFPFSTDAVDVQPDGKILLAGRYKMAANRAGAFAVARLNANGTRDRTFAAGGVADFLPNTNSTANAVHAMPDGSIYLAGGVNYGYPNDLDEYMNENAIAMQLDASGRPVASYGASGLAKLSGRFFAGATMRGAIGSDGSATIVAAGDDLAIYRFTPAGTPDTRFDENGIATGPSFSGYEFFPLVQSDGALLLAYRDFEGSSGDVVTDRIMCFTVAGKLDSAFGVRGIANAPSASQTCRLNVAAIANDGSILVAGQLGSAILVARYWRDDCAGRGVACEERDPAPDGSYLFNVAVRDDLGVDAASIDSSDFRVIAPDGREIHPTFVSIDQRRAPTLIGVNLKFSAPGGAWGTEDNGAWRVRILSNHVFDTTGHATAGRTLGTFWLRLA